jgi:hypothetical protein
MIQRLHFFLLFILCAAASAQRPVDYEKIKAFNVVVNYPDYTVKTQMLKEAKKLPADEELTYHWYSSNKIMSTKGGFDGKLLHGYYKSFYLNSNLRESGNFKYGLKKGEWRYWFEDGKLKEVITWKNGKKHGGYRIYDSSGSLIGKGNFKHDQLDGKFRTYSKGRLTETVKYKDGAVVPVKHKTKKAKVAEFEETGKEPAATKKEKRTFKERWNKLFRKKNKEVQKKTTTENEVKEPASNTTKKKEKKPKETTKKKEEKPKKEPKKKDSAKK